MADWAPQCGQMNDVITELSKQSELKVTLFFCFYIFFHSVDSDVRLPSHSISYASVTVIWSTPRGYNLHVFQDVRFCIVPAEDLSEVSLKHKIAAVPTFLLLRGGQVVERVEGANAADLTNKVKTQVSFGSF